MTRHSNEYQSVIASREWRQKRQRLIQERQGCERCFLITHKLEIHHKHYRALGSEADDDLEVLCQSCHKEADRHRAAESYANYYNSRVEGWAAKVYGEHWEHGRSWGDVCDKFDQWDERD